MAELSDSAERIVDVAGKKFRALSRLGLGESLASQFSASLRALSDLNVSPITAHLPSLLDDIGMTTSATQRAVRDCGLEQTCIASLEDVAAHSILSPGGDLHKAMDNDLYQAMGADSGLSAITNVAAMASLQGVGTALSDSITIDVASIMSPLVEAQAHFSSYVFQLSTESNELDYSRVAEQAGLIGAAYDHLAGLQQAEAASIPIQTSSLTELAQIPAQLENVAASYATVLQTLIEPPQLIEAGLLGQSCIERITAATVPFSYYTGAVRYLVESEITPEFDEGPTLRPVRQIQDLGNERLDHLLAKIDPDFADMRYGAWQALTSSNPERIRHAVTSQRELVAQLLRRIVPDLDISEADIEAGKGLKIKARVKVALRGSESSAVYVAALADAVFAHYSILCKYNHTNQKHLESARAILATGEGLIEYLLVNIDLAAND